MSKYGMCEQCGNAGQHVHHKIKLTAQNINDPMIALSWDNLQLLCLDCHNRAHGGASTAKGIMFDENGDLIPYPPVLGRKMENYCNGVGAPNTRE